MDQLIEELRDKVRLLEGFVVDVATYGVGDVPANDPEGWREAELRLRRQAGAVLNEFRGAPRELSRD